MTTTLQNRVDLIYSCYKTAMMSIANRKVSWPRAKDRTKTYLYMWIEKYLSWVDENELDDDSACKIIYALVKYAKRKRILYKGSSVLQHKHIYEIALKELEREDVKEETSIFGMRKAIDELERRRGNKSRDKYLSSRRGIGTSPNIVLLYESGILTTEFIAVSKSCRKALSIIDLKHRQSLPGRLDLFKAHQKIVLNKGKRREVSGILGSDFYDTK